MKHHFDKVDNLAGIVTRDFKGPGKVELQVVGKLTSDDPLFYKYVEKFSDKYLAQLGLNANGINNFIFLIHKDLSADLYLNDFKLEAEMSLKKSKKKGDSILENDIANIKKVRFPDIEILDTDKVIICLKVKWRFGLYFDVRNRADLVIGDELFKGKPLVLSELESSVAEIYRYLMFDHVYKTLQSQPLFDELIKEGWFPFIEISGKEYKDLQDIFESKFEKESRIEKLVKSFDSRRVDDISKKWWDKKIFKGKEDLIVAGIKAFQEDSKVGTINCIKTLGSEIEGILRAVYQEDRGTTNSPKVSDLVGHIIKKGEQNSGSKSSLFFTEEFLTYLQEVIFANFKVGQGDIPLSRHSTAHGVAESTQYTRVRALQMILVLDQIYFFL